MRIKTKHYNELTTDELFELLKIRQDVFIIEQTCIYEDIDDLDKEAYHVLCYYNEQIVGTARIIPSRLTSNSISRVGRIAVANSHRNKRLGREIIIAAINFISDDLKEVWIQISAQSHLAHYYQQFGFEQISEPYDDEGIMHIDMKRKNLNA